MVLVLQTKIFKEKMAHAIRCDVKFRDCPDFFNVVTRKTMFQYKSHCNPANLL